MKKVINSDEQSIVKNRLLLSRSLKLFTIKKITKEWSVTRATLERYDSEKYRKLSLSYRSKMGVRQLTCQTCSQPLKDHPRCPLCTILLHGKPCIHVPKLH